MRRIRGGWVFVECRGREFDLNKPLHSEPSFLKQSVSLNDTSCCNCISDMLANIVIRFRNVIRPDFACTDFDNIFFKITNEKFTVDYSHTNGRNLIRIFDASQNFVYACILSYYCIACK